MHISMILPSWEEQTHEIIEDVTNLKSELGVIYLSSKNTEVLSKMLKRNELEFTELLQPHRMYSYVTVIRLLQKRASRWMICRTIRTDV